MASPLEEKIAAFWLRYLALAAWSFVEDFEFKIDAAEQKRLDELKAKIQKLQELLEKHKEIDGVVATLTTDAEQQKLFQEKLNALPAASQEVAADVLSVMYQKPVPADQLDQLRKLMAALPAGQDMEVGKALNELGVYLPNLKPDSPGAEDASARIKKIHMSGAYHKDSPQGDYIRDMISRAKDQGFKVALQVKLGEPPPIADLKKQIVADSGGAIKDVAEFDKHVEIIEADKQDYVWAEDNKWLSADGSTIRTTPELSGAAQDKWMAFTTGQALKPGDAGYAQEGHHTAGQEAADPHSGEFPTGHIDADSFMGAVTQDKEHLSAQALAKATGKNVVTTRTYNEGGNMLAGTLPNGQPYGVIGRDGVLVSAFHLQEQFDANPKSVPEFDPKNVDARMGTMAFDSAEVKNTIEKLESAGLMKAKAKDIKAREKEAKQFLAKLDLVKDIFAEDTKVPRDQLIFVSQPDFHVDMHMRPVAPGQIMVNDFDENIKLIDDALKKTPKGSPEEKQLLSMRSHATDMKKSLGPVMDQIKKQAEQGGLKVTPAPGVMEGQFEKVTIKKTDGVASLIGLSADKDMTRKELGEAIMKKMPGASDRDRRRVDRFLDDLYTRHVNFMNAIPGTNDGTNEQFYMTNYTSIGPLRAAYEAYLTEKGVEKVHWMGDDGGGPNQRSASEWSLQAMGGLDCRENH